MLWALIDSELVVFLILCSWVGDTEVQRRESACGCGRSLSWRWVGGRRGIDLGQGGVTTAQTSLLGWAALRWGREEGIT